MEIDAARAARVLDVDVQLLGHAVDPAAPQLLVLVEQPSRHAQPLDVGAHDLASPGSVLADKAGPFEDRDVLLHSCEAHRVMACQLGDALLGVDRTADDVAAGVVRQCAEHAIEIGWGDLHSYNHTVV